MSSITTINRISRDTIIYIPVFLAPAFINIILLTMFTRLFSPGEYGTYTIVVNSTIIISSIVAQWIVLAVQRYRPEYQTGISEFNQNINQLLLYIAIGIAVLAVLMFWLVPALPFSYYLASVLLVITSIYFMVLGAVYQADLQAKKWRDVNVLQSVLKLSMITLLVFLVSVGPVSFIWGAAIAQLCMLIPMLRYTKTQVMFRPSPSFFAFTRKFWRYGVPLIGWYIGTTILNLTDRFMLEYFRSSHEVGIYSANFTISVQAIALLCNPLFFAIQPLMMNDIQQQRDSIYIENRISHFTRLFIAIALPLGGYFSIFHREVSEILLGSEFTSGAIIIPILILGFFAWNLGLYGQLAYQITERTKLMFYFVTAAAGCNFVLNLFFIPAWGVIGAAISTTAGFLVYTLLLYVYSFRLLKWKIPWRSFLKVLLLVFIAALPAIWIKDHFFLAAPPIIKMMIGLPYFLIYLTFLKREA